ncbi:MULTISPECIES: hypothetical protein [unclassified Aeromicrobium]|uniref:hypothetical protein n=1 Tax=unclassified Aeromicrobium TaxID=2633570 RepID=UPI00396B0756
MKKSTATTAASLSANESQAGPRLIPQDGSCPDWCTDHSRFANYPISESYPGIHQTENLTGDPDCEVRVEEGLDETVHVVAVSADFEIYLSEPARLRSLGRALISAADVLEAMTEGGK